jgi:hypothetical protein
VSVLLGNGDGTFQAAHDYAVSSGASAVAVADFNGDGKLDLAVTYLDPQDVVSVLLGNGNGTFQAAQKSYPVGFDPWSMAVGDFNGDGHLDLAVANLLSDNVSVLLGKGDGTFQNTQSYAAGSYPDFVAVGDFNGDGHLDLAVADFSSISVLLGNGEGTFRAAPRYLSGGNSPLAVAVGDFDHDGHLDLAVANQGYYDPGNVSVLLGKGKGTFEDAQSYAAGPSPTSAAVGDFNGDGIPDLVVAIRAEGD